MKKNEEDEDKAEEEKQDVETVACSHPLRISMRARACMCMCMCMCDAVVSAVLLKLVCKECRGHVALRTIDGTCNNLQRPLWGSSFQPFKRYLRPHYEDGRRIEQET